MLAFSVAVVVSFPPALLQQSWAASSLRRVEAARAELSTYLNEDVAWMTKTCGFDAKLARRLMIGAKGITSKHGDAYEAELKRIIRDSPDLSMLQVIRICRNKKIPTSAAQSVSRDLSGSGWAKMLQNILAKPQLERLHKERTKRLAGEVAADLVAAKLEPNQKKALEAELIKWATSLKILLPRPPHGEPWKQVPLKVLQQHLSAAQLKSVRAQHAMFVNGKALHEEKHTFLVTEILQIRGTIRLSKKLSSPLIAKCICLHDGNRVTAQSAEVITKVTPEGLEYACTMAPTKAPTSVPSLIVIIGAVDGQHVDMVSWPVIFAEPARSEKEK